MSSTTLLLCGPQRSPPNAQTLGDLRQTLLHEPRLYPLLCAIQSLPEKVHELSLVWPLVAGAPNDSRQAVDSIPEWLLTGHDSGLLASKSNALLSPLSVLVDLVSYYRLQLSPRDRNVSVESSKEPAPTAHIGLCLGVLSSTAIALSDQMREKFADVAAVATRLALVVGLIVDAQAQWTTHHALAHVVAISHNVANGSLLDQLIQETPGACVSVYRGRCNTTVTVPHVESTSFETKLTQNGLKMHYLPVRGMFHSDLNHIALEEALEHCGSDSDLRFDDFKTSITVWSGLMHKQLPPTELHEFALRSILVKMEDWYNTLRTAIGDVSFHGRVNITALGDCKYVPWPLNPPSGVHVHVKYIQAQLQADYQCSPEHQRSPNPEKPYAWSLGSSQRHDENDIAIIGMAGRFPEASSVGNLWDVICAASSAHSEIGQRRYNVNQSDDLAVSDEYWANLCTDIDAFDNALFIISTREAQYMDPQQRLILEVSYQALQSAGYLSRRKAGNSAVGCYLGVGAVDYSDNIADNKPSAYAASGSLRAFLSGKLSHYFGWTGPSMTYDTACSSSLVAIHSACSALRSGDCEMALAGGVSLITSPTLHDRLAHAGFLCTKGPSKAFDADASGYCRGEGAGVVVLKHLQQALKDKDEIYSVVAGSFVNQGDNQTPIMVPSVPSQVDLYNNLSRVAHIKPTDVGFVEAHGTGTPVGDPVEMESIRQVFGGANRQKPLYVGSLKSNIGHLESASGVASLIKAILMLRHQKIPPQANFAQLNPDIKGLEQDCVRISLGVRNLDASPICVNNYGAGGCNAAVMLLPFVPDAYKKSENEYRAEVDLTSKSSVRVLPFLFTANSDEALRNNQLAFLNWLKLRNNQSEDFSDVACSLLKRSDPKLPRSYAVAAASFDELNASLSRDALQPSFQNDVRERHLILCFGGQSREFVGLNDAFYMECARLRYHLNRVDFLTKRMGDFSIFPGIFSPHPISNIVYLHSMLFAVQYACAQCWIDCGAQISAVVGHSFGQFTAACIAGSLSLEDALRLIMGRAHLISSAWSADKGAMLAVECSTEAMAHVFGLLNNDVELACFNSPSDHVFAGPKESIEELEHRIEESNKAMTAAAQERVKYNRLATTHGFHCSLVDPILPGLKALLGTIKFQHPVIPLELCIQEEDEDFLSVEGIARHSRQPVYFSYAIQRLNSRLKSCTWLEAGTKSGIVSLIRRALTSQQRTPQVFQSTDMSSSDAWNQHTAAIVNLWREGHKVRFWPFERSQAKACVDLDLPLYQFQKIRHWLPLTGLNSHKRDIKQDRTFLPVEDMSLVSFIRPQNFTELFAEFVVNPNHENLRHYFEGHKVSGKSLCPASLYLAAATKAVLALQKEFLETEYSPGVKCITMRAPLILSPNLFVLVALENIDSKPKTWSFRITSFVTEEPLQRTLHVEGIVELDQPGFDTSNLSINENMSSLRRRKRSLLKQGNADTVIEGSFIYKLFGSAVEYKPYFQSIRKIAARGTEIASRISITDSGLPAMHSPWNVLLLDNIFQVAGIHANCLGDPGSALCYVCVELNEIKVHPAACSQASETWTVYSIQKSESQVELVYDIFAFDELSEDLLVVVLGARFLRSSKELLDRNLENATSSQKALPQAQKPRKKPTISPVVRSTTQQVKTPNPKQPDSQFASTLKRILSSLTDTAETDISQTSSLLSIGIDSLMMVETVKELESHFEVKLGMNEFRDVHDFETLCTWMSSKVSPNTSLESGIDESQQDSERDSRDLLFVNGGPENIDDSQRNDTVLTKQVIEEKSGKDGSAFSNTPDGNYSLEEKMSDFIAAAKSDKGNIVHLANSRQEFDRIAKQTQLAGFYDKVYQSHIDLVTAYIVEAFNNLGCFLSGLRAGHTFAPPFHLVAHSRLMQQLGRILVDQQYITITDLHNWKRAARPIESNRKPSKELIERLENFPQHNIEHCLLTMLGPHLAHCLSGRKEGVQLMFSDKATRFLVERTYVEAPMFSTATILLQQLLSAYALRAYEHDRRPPKVIEVGAGTGATTTAVLKVLDQLGIDYEYTFTDVSPSLVSAAKTRMSKNDRVKFSTLDIEKRPPTDMESHFDVVLAANVIHATRSLETSCRHLRNLLKLGGRVFLVELTRNLPWFDIVFGLLDGWWRFEDDRTHPLAHEDVWHKALVSAGFDDVAWSEGSSTESQLIRVITAETCEQRYPQDDIKAQSEVKDAEAQKDGTEKEEEADLCESETVHFGQVDNIPLYADLYYPNHRVEKNTKLPIAILVHGGGHVMLSRKDIRPKQKELLLSHGFLPVSIDYRLCPEVDLESGAMADVCTALQWSRTDLPSMTLQRQDIVPDGERVVVIGWSTGGQLALSAGWTAIPRGIRPPEAALVFYGPTDYESEWWRRPHYVWNTDPKDKAENYDMWDSVRRSPLTGYNIVSSRAPGGWMSSTDPRARIPLHMNWSGQTLEILTGAMSSTAKALREQSGNLQSPADSSVVFPRPGVAAVRAISPLAQVKLGAYKTPTFLIHGTNDEFMPWEATQEMHQALMERGIESDVRIVEGGGHMFEMTGVPKGDPRVWQSVLDGYQFLAQHVGLDGHSRG